MKVFRCFNIAIIASLVIAAPAFSQTSQTPTPASPQKKTSQVQKQHTQDGNSSPTVGPGSRAYKQPTQAEIPEIGPASGAYKGNVARSKY